jgi:hypothetical protein
MFHPRRTRRDPANDNPTDGGTAAPILLTLALVSVLRGSLMGTADATSQDMGARPAAPSTASAGLPQRVRATQATQRNRTPDDPPVVPIRAKTHLLLDPTEAIVGTGQPQAYTATLLIRVGPSQVYTARDPDTYSYLVDVTRWTRFSIRPDGVCGWASCTPAEIGEHTVTGTFPRWRRSPFHVKGTAVLHAEPVIQRLELRPDTARIRVGGSREYKAEGVAKDGSRHDVTAKTDFSITPSGSCPKAEGEVSCTATEPGKHTVTGTLGQAGQAPITAESTLHVDPVVDHLELKPIEATIELGERVSYTARAVAKDGTELEDVTAETVFSISRVGQPSGTCEGARCTPTKVGDHIVTGTLRQAGRELITGTAVLQVEPEPVVERLRLEPEKAEIRVGQEQDYKAIAVDQHGTDRDVTAQTEFTIDKGGSCVVASCSASRAQVHTVTGIVRDSGLSATATLTAVPRPFPRPPRILSVEPGSAPPNKDVVVEGTTGSCNPTGELTLKGTAVSMAVTGAFRSGFTVPPDTAPGVYRLELSVDCDRRSQLARRAFEVTPDRSTRLARLELQPPQASIVVGGRRGYTVEGFAGDGTGLGDFTRATSFSIAPDGTCDAASCSATTVGTHIVTGTVTQDGRRISGSAELQVLHRQPTILSGAPEFIFAGMAVEVRGNTGSCSRAGTLSFHGMAAAALNVAADEHGDFVARFTVPKGTFPRAYTLDLTIDCNGQTQRAEGELSVVNLAPVAVEDSARITQDTSVAIAVTANDRNPDPGTGYQTFVGEERSPDHGTIQVQLDGIIVYTPDTGFLGRDQFRYHLCDNIINAAGQADCSTATVTVTVTADGATTTTSGPGTSGGAPPISESPPSSGSPPSTGPPTTTKPEQCEPTTDNSPRIEVDPRRGSGGAKLGITAGVDRGLAACPFKLLLGGSPLGPDVQAGPDGSISAQRGVPNDARPGPSPVRLATTSGQVLAETPFEIVPPSPWRDLLLKLLVGAGALLAGALARAALRRWRPPLEEPARREPGPLPEDIRAEPHTSPVTASVQPDRDNTHTFTVRLEPHPDPGAQRLQEATR